MGEGRMEEDGDGGEEDGDGGGRDGSRGRRGERVVGRSEV